MEKVHAFPTSPLPNSDELLHTSVGVVAASTDHPWFQLGLKIELYRSSSPIPGQDVRILRVGTSGTMIDNQSYRSKNAKSFPLFAGTRDLFNYLESAITTNNTDVPTWEDEKRIFDKLFIKFDTEISIENSKDKDSEYILKFYNSNKLVNPSDWSIQDFSPKTKNNVTSVSTSTSIGITAGTFGGTPTLDVNYSESNSREWMVADYDILSSASVNRGSGSSVTWNIARSSPTTDPEIARSTFSPDLEAVFRTSQSDYNQRYSVVSALVMASYVLDKKTTSVGVPSPWEMAAAPFVNLFKPGALRSKPETTTKETYAEEIYWHMFSISLLVDWTAGRVIPLCKASDDGRAELLAADWKGSEKTPQNLKFEHFMPAVATPGQPVSAIPTFRGDSPVGVIAPDAANGLNVEIQIPTDRLFQYYGGFSVCEDVFGAHQKVQPVWGNFSNTALVRRSNANSPLFIVPSDYSNGFCFMGLERNNIRKISPKRAFNMSFIPDGSGISACVGSDENVPEYSLHNFSYSYHGYIYEIGTDSKQVRSYKSVISEKMVRSLAIGPCGLSVAISDNSIFLSSDCFEHGYCEIENKDKVNIGGKEMTLSDIFDFSGIDHQNLSVLFVMSYDETVSDCKNSAGFNKDESLLERSYFCIMGKYGIVYMKSHSDKFSNNEKFILDMDFIDTSGGSGPNFSKYDVNHIKLSNIPEQLEMLLKYKSKFDNEKIGRIKGSYFKIDKSATGSTYPLCVGYFGD